MKLLRSKKGFTLVELIVVIVIIAILAAALVTSLVGYIDKAKESNARVEANNAYVASQAYISEAIGTAQTPAKDKLLTTVDQYLGSSVLANKKAYIPSCIYEANGTISYYEYIATNGLTVYYTTDKGWEVTTCTGTKTTAGTNAAPYEIGTPKA